MKVKTIITGILALSVIALIMAPSLIAQSLSSGDLSGTVTDPSGAVVPNATVTLKSNGGGQNRSTTSNAAGAYRFSLLPPGSYTVSASAQGFSKAETVTTINIGQATVADVKLAVGSSSQTVEVTSAAPLVQADNAELSTNFDQTIVANAPNGGNDLTYIAQTAPGIQMNTGMGYGNFETAGLPATSNVFTMNGENQMDPYLNLNNSGATNLMLGKNATQEATVVTNAYGGQYGQQAGAQVNYVTKSGTNAYHGNATYWWTGSSMDANGYLNNFTPSGTLPYTPKAFNNNNQWAASVGGPIKKDKLFFFADWEGIRYIVPSSTTVFAPTAAFGAATVANLTTLGALGNAQAAASVPLYSKAFGLYQGAPNYGSGALVPGSCGGDWSGPVQPSNACFQSFAGNPSLPAKEWLIVSRIDYNLSDRDHLFWSTSFDHGTQATGADPINPAFSAASYQPQYNGQGEWTHTFGSNSTNQFIYAGSYYRAIFDQEDAAGTFPTQIYMNPLGYTSLGGPFGGAGEYIFPQGRNVTQYQFIDDFSTSKGAHNLKFGANFRRYDITDYVFSEFTNPLSVITDVNNFYNGYAGAFLQNFSTAPSMPVALWGMGLYAQDEWRVSKSLKLTFALRGEHNSNPVCQRNCSGLLTGPFQAESTDSATPYNQMILAGRHQIFRSTDSVNIAPRFGFAWSPSALGEKTVIRGGFGLFYDAFPATLGDTFMTNLPTVVPTTVASTNPAVPGVYWADQTTPGGAWHIASNSASQVMSGFGQGASFASLSAANPLFSAPSFGNALGQFHTPRYQEWSLQIEQQLDSRSSVSLAYVGNHGINEPVTWFPNAYGAAGPAGGYPGAPFSGNFSTITEVYSGAVSNFNGLTAAYQRRLTYGFTVQASYTWSHAMDEISNGGFLGFSSTSAEYQINPSCLRCNNYGNADYDIRNSMNGQYVWQIPWKFGNKFANGALGGWTLSQNFFYHSGLPLTVFDATTSLANTAGAQYVPAEVVGPGQSACGAYLLTCFNSAGFTSAPAGAANQARNVYRGPGFFDSDFTINKNFKLTERLAFGIGANMYNVFNHPNFAQPGNLFGTGTFGQITSQTAPPTGPFGSFFAGSPAGRIIQFQGKIVF
jgi:hypothetical protein